MSKKDEVKETENLKRRVQELTRDLDHTTAKVIEQIHKEFNILIKGELEAIDIYNHAITLYGALYGQPGWRGIFSDIIKDEYEHLEKLRISLASIEEVYKREGHIKS